MRRRFTQLSHQERISGVLHHIHAHLSESLDIAMLAELSCYSSYHFQRTFKQLTGESVHDYIRRARLEWAANLLIFNPESTVMGVAGECGFQSNASFTHAFKQHFGVTPTAWRDGGYQQTSLALKQQWLSNAENPNRRFYQQTADGAGDTETLPAVSVKRFEPIRVAYLRHIGYDHSIKTLWQRLLHWGDAQGLNVAESQMIGLYHSNPDIIPYDQCRYVACVTVPDDLHGRSGVDVMAIPGGQYACARGVGQYGDLIYLLHQIYHRWLPASDFETINIPAHVLYNDNHFLNDNGRFDAELRVPVRYKL